MARLLLTDQAKNWLISYENDDNTTEKWSALKNSIIILNFKPANTIVILRDQLYNLKQTSSISNYNAEFLDVKLSITNITNDEAIAQFVRGLKDSELKNRINRLYRAETAPPLHEVITEANIFESSTLSSQSYVTPNNYNGRNNAREVDDPMEKLLSMLSGNTNSRNNYHPRGTSYSAHRGSYYSNPRGGSQNYRGNGYNTRGSFHYNNRGGYRSDRGRGGFNGRTRMTINNGKCLECNRYGHIKAECPSIAPQKSYYMDNEYDEDDYYYEEYNQASSSHTDKNNNIENKHNSHSESYADTPPLLLYSVMPVDFE